MYIVLLLKKILSKITTCMLLPVKQYLLSLIICMFTFQLFSHQHSQQIHCINDIQYHISLLYGPSSLNLGKFSF